MWGISSQLTQVTLPGDGTSLAIGQPGPGQGQPLSFTWIGTAGVTALAGSNYGTNVFDLGPGGDTVTGGNNSRGAGGNNILLFDKGDGHAQVNLNGGVGTLRMAAGIAASDVILQADNLGDLTVKLLDTGDSVTFTGDLVQNWWGVSSQLGQVTFADGTSLTVGQPNFGQGQPLTFTWIGGMSAAVLTGSNYGTNVFDLGPGGDTVTGGNNSRGGSGSNIVAFDKGDGQARVDLNGGTGTLQMASDIAASDVILQADNLGNLTVKLLDTGDSVTFTNDLVQNWWGVSSRLGSIAFADGSSLNLGQPNFGQGQPLTFTWIGSAATTLLTGSSYGTNVFDLGPGGDTVTGGNNGHGGPGNNVVEFEKGDGQAHVNLNGGTGSIQMASDITAADVILQADSADDLIVKLRDSSDSLTVAGALVQNWWGVSSQVGQIGFADGTSMSLGQPNFGQGQPLPLTWVASAGNETLTGSPLGNNTLEADAGNDVLNGGGGYDTYKIGSAFGQTTINNLTSDGNSPKGQIDFAAGVAPNQLWLQRSGTDLKIDVLGTDQSLTVAGWYGNNARAQVQSIDTADGSKIDAQLQQLVSAMASFTAGNPGFDPTAAVQMPADPNLQAAIAAAWHH